MNKLAYYRKRNDLTQQQLGEMLGVSKQLVCTWERGAARIDIKHANKLKAALNISEEMVTALIEGSSMEPLLKFPVVTDVTVENWNTVNYPFDDLLKEYSEGRPLAFNQGRKGDFIIRVSRDTLLPWFPEGSLILVRPNASPISGKQVIIVDVEGKMFPALFTITEDNDAFYYVMLKKATTETLKLYKKEYPKHFRAVYQVVLSASSEEALREINNYQ